MARRSVRQRHPRKRGLTRTQSLALAYIHGTDRSRRAEMAYRRVMTKEERHRILGEPIRRKKGRGKRHA